MIAKHGKKMYIIYILSSQIHQNCKANSGIPFDSRQCVFRTLRGVGHTSQGQRLRMCRAAFIRDSCKFVKFASQKRLLLREASPQAVAFF
jgi:hypothetical protein